MLFGTAIFCSSCLNMLLPAASMVSPYAVIFVRIIQVQIYLHTDLLTLEELYRGR